MQIISKSEKGATSVMTLFEKPLADIDGLVGEIRTVTSNLRLLTLMIEDMETGTVPNRITFAEAMNATSTHLDRISEDLSNALTEILEKTAPDTTQSRQEPSGAVPEA